MQPVSKEYFRNLDALRFIAFLGVMLGHAWRIVLPEMKESSGITQFREWAQVGMLGVNFFFVLSGFLITYLLLMEEKERGSINVIHYYLRRTLRIWPLYFLIVILFFLIVPALARGLGKPYAETADPLYFIFFLVNFYIIGFGFPYSPVLAVLWTIAVEEQFYIVWPWLLKLFKRGKVILFLLLIAVNIFFRIRFHENSKMIYFHTLSIVSDFAIGGWMAWDVIRGSGFTDSIRKIPRWVIIAYYIFIAVLIIFYREIFSGPVATAVERVIFGTAFAFIIFEQTFCENRIFDLARIPGITYLGKISYGLYCFHELGIMLSTKFLQKLELIQSPVSYLVLMPLIALLITIGISSLSYRFFEKAFLNLKKRFEVV